MNNKYASRRSSMHILLFLVFMGGFALACDALTVPSSVTPTPTGQINAVEAGTATLTGDKKHWQVWKGTMVSQTSRKFMSNGNLVNTCQTKWNTLFAFVIDAVGDISGIGSADLTEGPTCSPHPVSGNTTHMVLSIDGRKDQTAVYLSFKVAQIEPYPSGDFGGYSLINTNGACPPTMQSLTIPLTSSTTAQAQLDLNATMTGCAGSKDDQMSNQSQVNLEYTGKKCSDNPFDPSDPAATICE